MRTCSFALTLVLCFSSFATADLAWTGNGDGVSLYQEANWTDDNGSTPSYGEIVANTAVTAAAGGTIRIDSGSGTPNNYGGNFTLGANDLIVGGGKTLRSDSSGINGSVGQTLTVSGGSTVEVQS